MNRSVLFFLALMLPCTLAAQEMSPRAYWPAPTGTQVVTVGASYTTGDTVPDPSLPITGLDSNITTGFVGYLRTLDLFGRSANLIFEVPYADGDTKSIHEELGSIKREYKGLGDIAATLSYNILGAPAMTPADFAELRRNPRPIVGLSLKVVAPTGDYDNDRIINVGANRWAAKAEIGSMYVLSAKWLLEFEAGAWFFDDNDDFLGRTKEQNEIYAAELHLIRRFSPGFWGSLDVNAYKGGRSKVDGVRLNDLQRDSKVGITLAFPVVASHALKMSYTHGSVNNSDESFDVFLVSYSKLF